MLELFSIVHFGYRLYSSCSKKGNRLDEVGIRKDTHQIIIRIEKSYFRPSEVSSLLGDASKAKMELDWEASINNDQ